MIRQICDGTLFAQQNRLDSLSRGFKGRHTQVDMDDVMIGLLIVVGVAMAIWLVSRIVDMREKRQSFRSPRRLFLSLCQAHRLRWTQRWLLWRLARAQKLRDPARLFLEPELLDPSQLRTLTPARTAQLQKLRESLFAEPDEPSNAAPPPSSEVAIPDRHEITPPPQFGAPIGAPGERPTLDVPPWTPPVQT